MDASYSELVRLVPEEVRGPALFSRSFKEMSSILLKLKTSTVLNVLRLSVFTDDASLFKVLFKIFPDINAKIIMDGYSNLSHHAAYNGNLDMLIKLVEFGVSIRKCGSVKGFSGIPAQIAFFRGHSSCHKFLETADSKYQILIDDLFNSTHCDMRETHGISARLIDCYSESLEEDLGLLREAESLLSRLKEKLCVLREPQVQKCIRFEDCRRYEVTMQAYEAFVNLIQFGESFRSRKMAQTKRSSESSTSLENGLHSPEELNNQMYLSL